MDDEIITPFNDGDILDILGNIKAHMEAAYCSDFDNYADCLYDALCAIEQLKRERDAAVADMRLMGDEDEFYCEICKNKNDLQSHDKCRRCYLGAENNFEWRGVTYEN